MINPQVQRYIDALKHGQQLSLLDDVRIVSGRAVLTVTPNIESETFTKLRVEIPHDCQPKDFQCFMIFIAAMFGEVAIIQLHPQINALLNHGTKAALKVEGQLLRMFVESENLVLTLEPIPSR